MTIARRPGRIAPSGCFDRRREGVPMGRVLQDVPDCRDVSALTSTSLVVPPSLSSRS